MLGQRIAVVSNSRETLDGVEEYLRRAGAHPCAIPSLEDAAVAARGADALLVFADDFASGDTLRAIDDLSVELIVVVTQDTESFRARRDRLPRPGRLVVLRRPAWGWMLLEALRTNAREDSSGHV